jgi:hypothetical protein
MKTIKQALVTAYPLTEWDPSGETIVWIKQVRQADDMRRMETMMRTRVERPLVGSPVEVVDFPLGELVFLECYLSYQDSTIAWEVPSDDGKSMKSEPMFPKDLNESAFRERFGQLEPDLVKEWQRAVRKHNPNWASSAEGN